MLTPVAVDGIPEELRAGRAWCCWRAEERGGKATKVPVRPDGGAFKSNDPTTWSTFDEAVAAHEAGGVAGIGRAIDADFVGIDVDWRHCTPPDPPSWLGHVLGVLDSWSEVSPSGLGVHVWLRARWGGGARQTRFPDGSMVEIYDAASPRFFTVTGQTMLTSPEGIRSGPEAQAALDQLAEELAKVTAPRKAAGNGRTHHEDELEGAPEGARRSALTSEAGRLRALGVSLGEARAVLLAVAAKCTPPVPEDHVEEILTWAWRKPAGDPRPCPVCGTPEPCAAHLAAPPSSRPQPVTEAPSLTWMRDAVVEAVAELDRFHVGDLTAYVSTGIVSLDQKLGGGLRRRQVVLVGAPTGGGKTTFLMQLAVTAAHVGSVLVVTPEMAAAELALREVVRSSRVMKWVRRPWAPRPDLERNQAAEAHTRAASRLLESDLPIAFLDRPAVTMADIEEAAESVRRARGPLSLVLVDYAQEIADTDPRTPRYLTVGAVASRSIALAAEQQAAVVVASQVNVIREGSEETFSMRESAILKHKAHFVLELVVQWEKRPDGSRAATGATIRCSKARNGPAFELPLAYRPELYLLAAAEPSSV